MPYASSYRIHHYVTVMFYLNEWIVKFLLNGLKKWLSCFGGLLF